MISNGEQAALSHARIAIAGVGGVGGRLATRLAALGVKSFAIADPDTFDVTNINRQEGADHTTVGQLKVDVIAERILAIAPDAIVDTWPDGINSNNVEDFVRGAHLSVEGADYLRPGIGVRLARASRSAGIPMVLGVEVGFGAFTTWFDPASSRTYERFLGFGDDVSPDAMDANKMQADFRRWVPHVPRYVQLSVMEDVAAGRMPAPAIAPAVDLCGAMLSTLTFELVIGQPGQKPAPAIVYTDVRERRTRTVRLVAAHHYQSLARMVLRDKAGLNR